MPKTPAVIYWDSSAVISALFKDGNSRKAKAVAERDALHVLTTLSYAEVSAVIFRMKRENVLTEVLSQSAVEVLDRGPWHRISISPAWPLIQRLASKHNLRGADLWHLAAAMTLKRELPDIVVLTFDQRLRAASEEAGLNVA
jgi:predicted nucleic acid-binding protein